MLRFWQRHCFAKIFFFKFLGLTKNNEGDAQTFPPANIYLGLPNIIIQIFLSKDYVSKRENHQLFAKIACAVHT